MKKWKLLFLMLLFSCAALVQGSGTITGGVRDKDGKPVAAATVTLKGKNVSTSTTADGNFTIRANPGDVLVFSSIGFEDYEAKIGNGRSAVNVTLNAKSNTLNDV